jgi:phosphoenolpyruvate phosphomutase
VIVPTRYYSTPTEVFREAGISTVIWANHLVRSAVTAMQSVAKDIHDSETLVNVEDRIVSVEEIFRLQNTEEYAAAERQYLAAGPASGSAIVLAATRGRGLEPITGDRPKVMLPIAGKPLLRWLVDGFKKHNIHDITVVGGYHAEAIDTADIKLAMNERYAETDELASLGCAVGSLRSDTIISYGDILFRSYVLRDLVESKADFAVVVDSLGLAPGDRTIRDFAYCSRGDDRGLFGTRALLERVTSKADPNGGTRDAASLPAPPQGQWIGLLKVAARGIPRFNRVLERLRERVDFDRLDLPALLNELIADGAAIEVLYVHGHWRGVNDFDDLRRAVDFAHAQSQLGTEPGEAAPERD